MGVGEVEIMGIGRGFFVILSCFSDFVQKKILVHIPLRKDSGIKFQCMFSFSRVLRFLSFIISGICT